MTADLASESAQRALRELTGRGGVRVYGAVSDTDAIRLGLPAEGSDEWLREHQQIAEARGLPLIVERGNIPPGRESGRHVPVPTAVGGVEPQTFVAFYQAMQSTFRLLRDMRGRELDRPSSRDPGRRSRDLGQAFFLLRQFLEDAHPAVERDWRNHVIQPERIDNVSVSLVGELAVALLSRFVRARQAVICRQCGQAALFDDSRRRQLCGDQACADAARREWKRANPEDPSAVNVRVKRHRATKRQRTRGRQRASR